MKMAAMSYGL